MTVPSSTFVVSQHLGWISKASFVVSQHLGWISKAAFVVSQHLGWFSKAAFVVSQHLGWISKAAFVVSQHLGWISKAAFVVSQHLGWISKAAFVSPDSEPLPLAPSREPPLLRGAHQPVPDLLVDPVAGRVPRVGVQHARARAGVQPALADRSHVRAGIPVSALLRRGVHGA